MILIGQFDSPFVRRVAIALDLYGMRYEHRPWSAFGDARDLGRLNPLMRVPTLVTGAGTVLVESHMMLDYLDGQVDEPLFPRAEPARHQALRIASLATGLGDKAVSLFYERRLHKETSPIWEGRCRAQIEATLGALNQERPASEWWFGPSIGHADIALACVLRFIDEAHPGLIPWAKLAALADHTARAESLPVFARIYQPFLAPA